MKSRLHFYKRAVALFLVLSVSLSGFPASAFEFAAPSLQPIRIVPQWGREVESYQSAAKPRGEIIFIQDAHDSVEAQINIARILNHLTETKKVRRVFEEGYEGPVPTQKYFGSFKKQSDRKKIGAFLLDHLRMGGAEYLHLMRPKQFELIGADNFKQHDQNIFHFGESRKKLNLIRGQIEPLLALYEKAAKQRFSGKAKQWFKEWNRIQSGELNLADYFSRLKKIAGENDLQALLMKYPQVALFNQALRNQDQPAVNALKPELLFEQLKSFEVDWVKQNLKDDDAQKIFHDIQFYRTVLKVAEIKADPLEYRWVRNEGVRGKTQGSANILARITKQPVAVLAQWESELQPAFDFYETANARDSSVMANLRNMSRGETVALVFGGFHREQLTALLKKEGFSYRLIMPAIKAMSPKHQKIYQTLMTTGRLEDEPADFANRFSRPRPIYRFPVDAVGAMIERQVVFAAGTASFGMSKSQRSEMRQSLNEWMDQSRGRLLIKTDNQDAVNRAFYLKAKQEDRKFLRIRLRDADDLSLFDHPMEVKPNGEVVRKQSLFQDILFHGGTIFLDFTNADPQRVEQLNVLFGDPAKYNGELLSQNTRIVVGMSEKQMGDYSNTVFSRCLMAGHDDVEWGEGVEQPEVIVKSENTPADYAEFDLRESREYMRALIGYTDYSGDIPKFVAGALAQAIQKKKKGLVIQGARQNDPVFMERLRQMLIERRVLVNGSWLDIPADFKIQFQERDYAQGVTTEITHTITPLQPGEELWVINRETVMSLYKRISVGADGASRENPGILNLKNPDGSPRKVRIRISEDLQDMGDWHAIMHAQNVTRVELVDPPKGIIQIPETYLPFIETESIAPELATNLEVSEEWNPEESLKPGTIVSVETDDLDMFKDHLEDAAGKSHRPVLVLSAGSGTTTGRLISNYKQKAESKGILPLLEVVAGEMLQALERGDVVLLQGAPRSADLMQKMPGLFSETPYLVINGERRYIKDFKGTLIFVADAAEGERGQGLAHAKFAYYDQETVDRRLLKNNPGLTQKQINKIRKLFSEFEKFADKKQRLSYSRLNAIVSLWLEFDNNWIKAFDYGVIPLITHDPEKAAHMRVMLKLFFNQDELERKGSKNIAQERFEKLKFALLTDSGAQNHFWQLHDLLPVSELKKIPGLAGRGLETTAEKMAQFKALFEGGEMPEFAGQGNEGIELLRHVWLAQEKFGMSKEQRKYFKERFELAAAPKDLPAVDESLNLDIDTPEKVKREIARIVRAVPLAFIQGPPGAGKSYILPAVAKELGFEPQDIAGPFTVGTHVKESDVMGESNQSAQTLRRDVQDWKDSERKLLAIDEANLPDSDFWWPLEDRLDSDHPVLMTGNSDDTVDRNRIRVVESRGAIFPFMGYGESFLRSQIEEKLKKADGDISDFHEILVEKLLLLHRMATQMNPAYEFSVRELQEAVNRILVFVPKQNDEGLALYHAWMSYRERFNQGERKAMEFLMRMEWNIDVTQMHAERLAVLREAMKKDTGIVLNSETLDYLNYWDTLITLRQARMDGKITGGKISSIVLGPSGWGKDAVLERFLMNQHGFVSRNMKDPEAAAGQNKNAVYFTNGSMNDLELERMIARAKHEGAILIVSEMDLLRTGILEGKLNNLLANGEPTEPGFLFGGTLNGSNFAGRNRLSSPMMSRSNVFQVEPYEIESLENLAFDRLKADADSTQSSKIKNIAHFQRWILGELKDEQYAPTTREIYRAVDFIKAYPKKTWQEIARIVYGPVFLNWQLDQSSRAEAEKLLKMADIRVQPVKDPVFHQPFAQYQYLIDYLVPSGMKAPKVATNVYGRNYFDAQGNIIHISSDLILSSGEARWPHDYIATVFMFIQALHADSVRSQRLITNAISEYFEAMFDLQDPGEQWKKDQTKKKLAGSPRILVNTLGRTWLSMLLYSRMPSITEVDFLNNSEIERFAAMVRDGEKGIEAFSAAIDPERAGLWGPRDVFRYAAAGLLNGTITLHQLKNFEIALNQNKAFKQISALTQFGDAADKDGKIKFLSGLGEHLEAMNALRTQAENAWAFGLRGEDLLFARSQLSALMRALTEAFEQLPAPDAMDIQQTPQNVLDKGASLDAAARAQAEAARRAAQIAKKFEDILSREIIPPLELIEGQLDEAAADELIIRDRRMNEIENQLNQEDWSRHHRGSTRGGIWELFLKLENQMLRQMDDPEGAKKQELEKVRERIDAAKELLQTLKERYDALRDQGLIDTQDDEEKDFPFDDLFGEGGTRTRAGTTTDLRERNTADALYDTRSDADESPGIPVEPLDESQFQVVGNEKKVVTIQLKPSKPKEPDAAVKALRESAGSEFNELLNRVFYAMMTDSRDIRSVEGDLDLELFARTMDLESSRVRRDAASVPAAKTVVITAGRGPPSPLAEDFFEFLFDHDFKVVVVQSEKGIIPVKSLAELTQALEMPRTYESNDYNNEQLAMTLSRENYARPWLVALPELTQKIQHLYLNASVRAAISKNPILKEEGKASGVVAQPEPEKSEEQKKAESQTALEARLEEAKRAFDANKGSGNETMQANKFLRVERGQIVLDFSNVGLFSHIIPTLLPHLEGKFDRLVIPRYTNINGTNAQRISNLKIPQSGKGYTVTVVQTKDDKHQIKDAADDTYYDVVLDLEHFPTGKFGEALEYVRPEDQARMEAMMKVMRDHGLKPRENDVREKDGLLFLSQNLPPNASEGMLALLPLLKNVYSLSFGIFSDSNLPANILSQLAAANPSLRVLDLSGNAGECNIQEMQNFKNLHEITVTDSIIDKGIFSYIHPDFVRELFINRNSDLEILSRFPQLETINITDDVNLPDLIGAYKKMHEHSPRVGLFSADRSLHDLAAFNGVIVKVRPKYPDVIKNTGDVQVVKAPFDVQGMTFLDGNHAALLANVLLLTPEYPLTDPNIYYELSNADMLEYNRKIIQSLGLQDKVEINETTPEGEPLALKIIELKIKQRLSSDEMQKLTALRGISFLWDQSLTVQNALNVMPEFIANNPRLTEFYQAPGGATGLTQVEDWRWLEQAKHLKHFATNEDFPAEAIVFLKNLPLKQVKTPDLPFSALSQYLEVAENDTPGAFSIRTLDPSRTVRFKDSVKSSPLPEVKPAAQTPEARREKTLAAINAHLASLGVTLSPPDINLLEVMDGELHLNVELYSDQHIEAILSTPNPDFDKVIFDTVASSTLALLNGRKVTVNISHRLRVDSGTFVVPAPEGVVGMDIYIEGVKKYENFIVLDPAHPLSDPNIYYELDQKDLGRYNTAVYERLTGKKPEDFGFRANDSALIFDHGSTLSIADPNAFQHFRGIKTLNAEALSFQNMKVISANNPGIKNLSIGNVGTSSAVGAEDFEFLSSLAKLKYVHVEMDSFPPEAIRYLRQVFANYDPAISGASITVPGETLDYINKNLIRPASKGDPGAVAIHFEKDQRGAYFTLVDSDQPAVAAVDPSLEAQREALAIALINENERLGPGGRLSADLMAKWQNRVKIIRNEVVVDLTDMTYDPTMYIETIEKTGGFEWLILPRMVSKRDPKNENGTIQVRIEYLFHDAAKGEGYHVMIHEPDGQKPVLSFVRYGASENTPPAKPLSASDNQSPEAIYDLSIEERIAYNQPIIDELRRLGTSQAEVDLWSMGVSEVKGDSQVLALKIEKNISDQEKQLVLRLRGIDKINFQSVSITPKDMAVFTGNNPKLSNIDYAIGRDSSAEDWQWLENLRSLKRLSISEKGEKLPSAALSYLANLVGNPLVTLNLPGQPEDYSEHLTSYSAGAPSKFIRINFHTGSTGSALFSINPRVEQKLESRRDEVLRAINAHLKSRAEPPLPPTGQSLRDQDGELVLDLRSSSDFGYVSTILSTPNLSVDRVLLKRVQGKSDKGYSVDLKYSFRVAKPDEHGWKIFIDEVKGSATRYDQVVWTAERDFPKEISEINAKAKRLKLNSSAIDVDEQDGLLFLDVNYDESGLTAKKAAEVFALIRGFYSISLQNGLLLAPERAMTPDLEILVQNNPDLVVFDSFSTFNPGEERVPVEIVQRLKNLRVFYNEDLGSDGAAELASGNLRVLNFKMPGPYDRKALDYVLKLQSLEELTVQYEQSTDTRGAMDALIGYLARLPRLRKIKFETLGDPLPLSKFLPLYNAGIMIEAVADIDIPLRAAASNEAGMDVYRVTDQGGQELIQSNVAPADLETDQKSANDVPRQRYERTVEKFQGLINRGVLQKDKRLEVLKTERIVRIEGDRVIVNLSMGLDLPNPDDWKQVAAAASEADEFYAAESNISSDAIAALPVNLKVLILNRARNVKDWNVIARFGELEALHADFNSGLPADEEIIKQINAAFESVPAGGKGFKLFDKAYSSERTGLWRVKLKSEPASDLEKQKQILNDWMSAHGFKTFDEALDSTKEAENVMDTLDLQVTSQYGFELSLMTPSPDLLQALLSDFPGIHIDAIQLFGSIADAQSLNELPLHVRQNVKKLSLVYRSSPNQTKRKPLSLDGFQNFEKLDLMLAKLTAENIADLIRTHTTIKRVDLPDMSTESLFEPAAANEGFEIRKASDTGWTRVKLKAKSIEEPDQKNLFDIGAAQAQRFFDWRESKGWERDRFKPGQFWQTYNAKEIVLQVPPLNDPSKVDMLKEFPDDFVFTSIILASYPNIDFLNHLSESIRKKIKKIVLNSADKTAVDPGEIERMLWLGGFADLEEMVWNRGVDFTDLTPDTWARIFKKFPKLKRISFSDPKHLEFFEVDTNGDIEVALLPDGKWVRVRLKDQAVADGSQQPVDKTEAGRLQVKIMKDWTLPYRSVEFDATAPSVNFNANYIALHIPSPVNRSLASQMGRLPKELTFDTLEVFQNRDALEAARELMPDKKKLVKRIALLVADNDEIAMLAGTLGSMAGSFSLPSSPQADAVDALLGLSGFGEVEEIRVDDQGSKFSADDLEAIFKTFPRLKRIYFPELDEFDFLEPAGANEGFELKFGEDGEWTRMKLKTESASPKQFLMTDGTVLDDANLKARIKKEDQLLMADLENVQFVNLADWHALFKKLPSVQKLALDGSNVTAQGLSSYPHHSGVKTATFVNVKSITGWVFLADISENWGMIFLPEGAAEQIRSLTEPVSASHPNCKTIHFFTDKEVTAGSFKNVAFKSQLSDQTAEKDEPQTPEARVKKVKEVLGANGIVLSRLEQLSLSEGKVFLSLSDLKRDNWDFLAQLPAIDELGLNSTNVSLDGLSALDISRLVRIDLNNVTSVTDWPKALKRIFKAPNLAVAFLNSSGSIDAKLFRPAKPGEKGVEIGLPDSTKLENVVFKSDEELEAENESQSPEERAAAIQKVLEAHGFSTSLPRVAVKDGKVVLDLAGILKTDWDILTQLPPSDILRLDDSVISPEALKTIDFSKAQSLSLKNVQLSESDWYDLLEFILQNAPNLESLNLASTNVYDGWFDRQDDLAQPHFKYVLLDGQAVTKVRLKTREEIGLSKPQEPKSAAERVKAYNKILAEIWSRTNSAARHFEFVERDGLVLLRNISKGIPGDTHEFFKKDFFGVIDGVILDQNFDLSPIDWLAKKYPEIHAIYLEPDFQFRSNEHRIWKRLIGEFKNIDTLSFNGGAKAGILAGDIIAKGNVRTMTFRSNSVQNAQVDGVADLLRLALPSLKNLNWMPNYLHLNSEGVEFKDLTGLESLYLGDITPTEIAAIVLEDLPGLKKLSYRTDKHPNGNAKLAKNVNVASPEEFQVSYSGGVFTVSIDRTKRIESQTTKPEPKTDSEPKTPEEWAKKYNETLDNAIQTNEVAGKLNFFVKDGLLILGARSTFGTFAASDLRFLDQFTQIEGVAIDPDSAQLAQYVLANNKNVHAVIFRDPRVKTGFRPEDLKFLEGNQQIDTYVFSEANYQFSSEFHPWLLKVLKASAIKTLRIKSERGLGFREGEWKELLRSINPTLETLEYHVEALLHAWVYQELTHLKNLILLQSAEVFGDAVNVVRPMKQSIPALRSVEIRFEEPTDLDSIQQQIAIGGWKALNQFWPSSKIEMPLTQDGSKITGIRVFEESAEIKPETIENPEPEDAWDRVVAYNKRLQALQGEHPVAEHLSFIERDGLVLLQGDSIVNNWGPDNMKFLDQFKTIDGVVIAPHQSNFAAYALAKHKSIHAVYFSDVGKPHFNRRNMDMIRELFQENFNVDTLVIEEGSYTADFVDLLSEVFSKKEIKTLRLYPGVFDQFPDKWSYLLQQLSGSLETLDFDENLEESFARQHLKNLKHLIRRQKGSAGFASWLDTHVGSAKKAIPQLESMELRFPAAADSAYEISEKDWAPYLSTVQQSWPDVEVSLLRRTSGPIKDNAVIGVRLHGKAKQTKIETPKERARVYNERLKVLAAQHEVAEHLSFIVRDGLVLLKGDNMIDNLYGLKHMTFMDEFTEIDGAIISPDFTRPAAYVLTNVEKARAIYFEGRADGRELDYSTITRFTEDLIKHKNLDTIVIEQGRYSSSVVEPMFEMLGKLKLKTLRVLSSDFIPPESYEHFHLNFEVDEAWQKLFKAQAPYLEELQTHQAISFKTKPILPKLKVWSQVGGTEGKVGLLLEIALQMKERNQGVERATIFFEKPIEDVAALDEKRKQYTAEVERVYGSDYRIWAVKNDDGTKTIGLNIQKKKASDGEASTPEPLSDVQKQAAAKKLAAQYNEQLEGVTGSDKNIAESLEFVARDGLVLMRKKNDSASKLVGNVNFLDQFKQVDGVIFNQYDPYASIYVIESSPNVHAVYFENFDYDDDGSATGSWMMSDERAVINKNKNLDTFVFGAGNYPKNFVESMIETIRQKPIKKLTVSSQFVQPLDWVVTNGLFLAVGPTLEELTIDTTYMSVDTADFKGVNFKALKKITLLAEPRTAQFFNWLESAKRAGLLPQLVEVVVPTKFIDSAEAYELYAPWDKNMRPFGESMTTHAEADGKITIRMTFDLTKSFEKSESAATEEDALGYKAVESVLKMIPEAEQKETWTKVALMMRARGQARVFEKWKVEFDAWKTNRSELRAAQAPERAQAIFDQLKRSESRALLILDADQFLNLTPDQILEYRKIMSANSKVLLRVLNLQNNSRVQIQINEYFRDFSGRVSFVRETKSIREMQSMQRVIWLGGKDAVPPQLPFSTAKQKILRARYHADETGLPTLALIVPEDKLPKKEVFGLEDFRTAVATMIQTMLFEVVVSASA